MKWVKSFVANEFATWLEQFSLFASYFETFVETENISYDSLHAWLLMKIYFKTPESHLFHFLQHPTVSSRLFHVWN